MDRHTVPSLQHNVAPTSSRSRSQGSRAGPSPCCSQAGRTNPKLLSARWCGAATTRYIELCGALLWPGLLLLWGTCFPAALAQRLVKQAAITVQQNAAPIMRSA